MSSTDSAHMPAASAPPGFTSDLEHPITKNVDPSITISVVGMIISTTFLIIRIYTKACLARMFSADDVCLILAWCMGMLVQISIVYYMAVGVIGTHIWDLSVANFQRLAQITAVASVVYLIMIGLTKFSILLFYLKLSRERWFVTAIRVTMFVIIGYASSLSLALIFACNPLKRVWDVFITEGYCINRGQIYLATAGTNAATDVIMLALPMPMIRKLQVPFRQKIGLALIFAIGSFTMVTSVIRLCLMPPLVKATDISWDMYTPSTWINVEANLFIICGSLPVMRLFLKHVAPRLIGETNDHLSSYNSNRARQGTSTNELSNLEKSKRNYARMADHSILMETRNDDSSETHIMSADDKSTIAVSNVEVEGRTPQELPAYGQWNPETRAFPTPPLNRNDDIARAM